MECPVCGHKTTGGHEFCSTECKVEYDAFLREMAEKEITNQCEYEPCDDDTPVDWSYLDAVDEQPEFFS